VGVFLSVDTKEGNAQGVNPYGYVRENPETATDPTGERVIGCQPGTQGCSPTGVPTPSPQCGRGYELKGGTCIQDGNWPGGGKPPSGSGGGGTKTGVGPEKPKTQCDDTCQAQERRAYQDAEAARDYFQRIADLLAGEKGVIIGAIFAILGLAGNFLGTLLSGLSFALSDLGNIAGDIASWFRVETDQQDMRSGLGLSWFNRDNVTASGDQILGNIISEGLTHAAVGLVISIASFFGAVAAGSIAEAAAALVPVLAQVAIGAMTFVAVVAIGTAVFYDKASTYIGQEETDAPWAGGD